MDVVLLQINIHDISAIVECVVLHYFDMLFDCNELFEFGELVQIFFVSTGTIDLRSSNLTTTSESGATGTNVKFFKVTVRPDTTHFLLFSCIEQVISVTLQVDIFDIVSTRSTWNGIFLRNIFSLVSVFNMVVSD